jgi:hypothetical protein
MNLHPRGALELEYQDQIDLPLVRGTPKVVAANGAGNLPNRGGGTDVRRGKSEVRVVQRVAGDRLDRKNLASVT